MSARLPVLILIAVVATAAPARAQSERVGLGLPIVEPPVLAQVPPPPPPPPLVVPRDPLPEDAPWLRTEWGLRTWLSTGHSSLSVAGANGAPAVLSRLNWSRLDNTVIELSADMVLRDRWLLNFAFGIGTNGGGQLRDRDFDDDESRSSDTVHPVQNDQLFYFNIDFGYRFIAIDFGADRRGRFTLDGLIGYQHWQERYLANDGVDLFPGDRVFPQGRIGENRFSWDSLRIGARARVAYPVWSLEGRIHAVPTTSFRDIDIHFLRDDVLHDPSFIDRASGGSGVMGDVTLRYRLWRGLQLEAGYRWWSLSSGAGQTTTRTPSGDLLSPLNDARTLRHGLTVGLLYQF